MLQALHHPFTAPRFPEGSDGKADLASASSWAYDMVLDGFEIGGQPRSSVVFCCTAFGKLHAGSKLVCTSSACSAAQSRVFRRQVCCDSAHAAGGSLRIHKTDVQMAVFQAIGLTPEQARQKFGFLLDALDSGAPPHGGIAFGLDRSTC